jgi:ABC-2 type transport system ATP-binding protein
MLCTLATPSGGRATVAGFDLVREPGEVRLRIGVALQEAALDPKQTGTELLRLQGRLYGLPHDDIEERLVDLRALVDLGDALDRRIATYSGGMRRRLDLAAALVARPPVVFLDEPTTGLDPRSRLDLWETIETLVAEGATVLLTTQYLDEADRLADKIAVIDHGLVIAEGTATELKDRVGGMRVVAHLAEGTDPSAAASALAPMSDEAPEIEDRMVRVRVPRQNGTIMEAVRRLDDAGAVADDVAVREPTLDDVFLALTGRELEPEEEDGADAEREEVAR